jgi:hypothetical protein
LYIRCFLVGCMNLRILHPIFLSLKGVGALVEIVTPSGTIQIIYQMTLGEISIVTVLSLVLIFQVLKWLLDNIWRNGGR